MEGGERRGRVVTREIFKMGNGGGIKYIWVFVKRRMAKRKIKRESRSEDMKL